MSQDLKLDLANSSWDSQLFAFLHMAKQHKADLSALFWNLSLS